MPVPSDPVAGYEAPPVARITNLEVNVSPETVSAVNASSLRVILLTLQSEQMSHPASSTYILSESVTVAALYVAG